jgi:hypothetical protein
MPVQKGHEKDMLIEQNQTCPFRIFQNPVSFHCDFNDMNFGIERGS